MVRNILLILNDDDYDKFEKDKLLKKHKSWTEYFLKETKLNYTIKELDE